MKTVLSIFGGLIMMGAVASASAHSFDVEQGKAVGQQQLQCLSLPSDQITTCLSNSFTDWVNSWI